MKLRRQILKTTAAWAILALFMAFTTPQNLPVVVLIVPFVLLYIAFYSTWSLIEAFRDKLSTRPRRGHRSLGIALSLSAVLLIVLQSLGQLTARDVITLLAIIIIGYLYLTRSHFVIPKR